mgnify:CR=1 FL=1
MVELYIDEQRNIHIWYIIRHGDLKTGSSYKLGRERRSDAIPTATRIFIYEHAYAIGPLINNETYMLSTEFNIVCSLTCKHFRFRRRHADFCTTRAYFDVGLCTNRLGVIENLGVAVGIVFLPF